MTAAEDPGGRIDKWLWATRIFKTRSLAADACRAGAVAIGERCAKPAREVRSGETITVKQGLVTRTLRVVGVPPSRVGARIVPEFCIDLTPASEFAKAREQRVQHLLAGERGGGRPTKRNRRRLEKFLDP
jgi:ribosome-associated heat shock protein Hsp15